MTNRLFVLICTALLYTNVLFAAPADLDPAFGTGGSTVGSHLDVTYYDAAIQADGKIVVFGVDNRPGMFLSRYLPDGTLDTSFSVDGIEDVDFGSGSAIGKDLVIQPDGKLLVMSWSSGDGNGDVGVARYNTDGTLDDTFGGDGTIVQSLNELLNPGGISYDVPDAMALQPDGKILVTGFYKVSTQDQLFVLRLNSDGTPDTSFRTVGAFRYTLGQQSVQYGHDIMVKPDGKIVVLGQSWTGGSSYDSLVLVLNPDGTHDFDFVGSGSGWVLEDFGNNERFTSGVIQPDGKIVASGWAGPSNNEADFLVVRYNADGSRDNTFANAGVFTFDIGAFDRGWDLALQPDGKLLISGWGTSFNTLIRLNSNGTLDSTFGNNGVGGTADGVGRGVVLQSDGRIIVVGTTDATETRISRFEGNNVDTVPAPFNFMDALGVATDSVSTSDTITISGLGAGVSVPVVVQNGEYTTDGGVTYTASPGYVQNDDQVTVRHTASSAPSTDVDTDLSIGGIFPTNSLVPTGTLTGDTYTSTTAGAVNSPPTANAGADQTATSGDTVNLDGSASSDSDGTVDGYSWTEAGGAITITNSDSSTASFTAPTVTVTTVYTVTLTVTDNAMDTASDTMTVTVNPVAPPPPPPPPPAPTSGGGGPMSLVFLLSLAMVFARRRLAYPVLGRLS